MEYLTLKNSDLKVSRMCMGGCPMGGYGWGSNVLESELIDAVHCALDNEINFFDTADTYGLGQSEITLGKALKGRRDKAVIASKFGVHAKKGMPTFYDNSPEWIKSSIKGTLKRLGTDYLDLYQIHYRDKKTPLAEVVDTLEELKKAGYIRYYGLSNIHKSDVAELKEYKGNFVSFQDEYSLACRKNEDDFVKLSKDLSLTPLTWGSLGQGILTGKYDKNTVFAEDDRRSRDIYVNFHGEKLVKNLEIVEALKKISNDTGKSIPAVAIRFILDFLKDSVVLVGIKRPSQLKSNIEAFGWQLDDEQIKMLDEISKA